MVERSAAAAALAMDGKVIAGDPAMTWSGAALDSRRVRGGEIFFALPGEQVDGHQFVGQAAAGGAATLVIHRDVEPSSEASSTWIRVDDTYRALHALTRAVRKQVPERLAAITGSAGKTTTKELLAAMLARRYRTARSRGNFNNLYGFPLSLLGIRDDCQWMVAEMGMSTPGELRQISLLGRPDVAVFTNVRPAHLENFSSVSDIADAKAELLAGLRDGGLVVANADDLEVLRIVGQHRADPDNTTTRYVLYGLAERGQALKNTADWSAMEVTATPPEALSDRPGSRFVLSAGDEEVDVTLPIHGLYNVENCLAAAACAHAAGVPLSSIVDAVADLENGPMRGEVHRLDGLTIIDDTYNSNPDAATKALASARELPARRHVAVLGDMLELGPKSPSFHRAVGDEASKRGFGLVVGVGELARELVDAVQEHGVENHWFADAGEAANWATASVSRGELSSGDLILIKGSRGIGLEVVVRALLEASMQPSGEPEN